MAHLYMYTACQCVNCSLQNNDEEFVVDKLLDVSEQRYVYIE